jgi:uncharacterized protein (DUF433 family)
LYDRSLAYTATTRLRVDIACQTNEGICCTYETANCLAQARRDGGTAVFHGTRVPVQTLLDYLEAGESIDDFLAGFPSVTRQQVIAFLEEAKDRLIETAS